MMLEITINDEYDVYQSGTVITHENKAVCFYIYKLKIRMLFKEDLDKKGDSSVEMKLSEKKDCLDIILINYDNILGQGLIRPIEVGVLDGKRLSVQFIILSLNETGTKVVHYTWLLNKTEHESK